MPATPTPTLAPQTDLSSKALFGRIGILSTEGQVQTGQQLLLWQNQLFTALLAGFARPPDKQSATRRSWLTRDWRYILNQLFDMAKRQIPPEIRKLCYERDHGACQWPGCNLNQQNGGVMNLHHIHPEQFGGQEDPGNLITLCDIHHKRVHSEFSAFYPDSQSVLQRMNAYIRKLLSGMRSVIKVDDGLDLKFHLKLLTGREEFRPGQLEVIRAARKGRDVLFVTPTGSGKSVCYQIPGLLADKPSLVISPLKALMKDQVESIWDKKIPATYINGDLSAAEKENRYRFIDKDLYKFIFVAPERFESKEPQTASLYRDYSYFVVDEAHEIEMWGMAFRPSYRNLGDLRQKLKRPPIIALTATASKSTQQHILKSLGAQDAKVVVTGFHRPNIEIKIIKGFRQFEDKYSYILRLLQADSQGKTLIFVQTVKHGRELLAYLRNEGIEVAFFHSKLDSKDKMRLQNTYTGIEKPELQTLISTSAFGMGIDIPNIRRIIHLTPALSLTDYVQQTGRAGRDGSQSQAYLLYHPQDAGLLKFMAEKQLQTPDFKRKNSYSDDDLIQVKRKLLIQVDEMLELTNQPFGMEWRYILDYFGEAQFSSWQRAARWLRTLTSRY